MPFTDLPSLYPAQLTAPPPPALALDAVPVNPTVATTATAGTLCSTLSYAGGTGTGTWSLSSGFATDWLELAQPGTDDRERLLRTKSAMTAAPVATHPVTVTVTEGPDLTTSKALTITVVAGGTGGGDFDLPADWTGLLRQITGIDTYAKLSHFLTGGTYNDPVLGNVTARAGDEVVLEDGTYDGANLTDIVLPGTNTNPFVIRSKNLLKSIITFRISPKSTTRTYFHGLLFDLSPGGVRSGRLDIKDCTNPKVWRCEFKNWWGDNSATQGNQSGHAIRTTSGGSGIEIGYCYFHDPKPFSQAEIDQDYGTTVSLRIFVRIGGDSLSSFHTGGHIHHCMLASTILRARPDVYASQADLIEVGFNGPSYPQPNPNAPVDLTGGWLIEDTIFDGTGAGGRPVGYTGSHTGDVDPNPSGVVDVKISGPTFRRCTFRNGKHRGSYPNPGIGRFDLRFGAVSRVESCFFKNNFMLGIQGEKHTIIGNKMGSGCAIWCLTGSIEANAYPGSGGTQRAKLIKLIGNNGDLDLGRKFTNQNLGCLDGRVEAHTGTIKTQQDYPGTWDTPSGGQVETGATYTATASEPVTLGVEVSNNAVGPYAVEG